MKPVSAMQTAIICAAAVAVTVIVMIPFELPYKLADGATANNSKYLVYVVLAGVLALGMALIYRYQTIKKRAQLELTSGEQYRNLADEYRRLMDMAITAQEHTDLKLGDVSAQLDHLREQNNSLQKILKDVE
ncbi:MAG TPA: hypothetical protein VMG13_23755 [Trebonia sp.]|nr:hypothetical protein [Trebonia sp.]